MVQWIQRRLSLTAEDASGTPFSVVCLESLEVTLGSFYRAKFTLVTLTAKLAAERRTPAILIAAPDIVVEFE